MPNPTAIPDKSGLPGKIITQALGLLVCIGIPAAVTAMAPVSWIKFQRQGVQVTARADTCLFFIIPFRTIIVDPVTSVGQRTNSGSATLHRRSGREHNFYTQSDSEGFLAIQGPNNTAEVSVSPSDIESITGKAEAFLRDASATQLKLFVVANWKFSIIAGGLVSLLTVLYLGGLVLGLGRFLLRGAGLVGKRDALDPLAKQNQPQA